MPRTFVALCVSVLVSGCGASHPKPYTVKAVKDAFTMHGLPLFDVAGGRSSMRRYHVRGVLFARDGRVLVTVMDDAHYVKQATPGHRTRLCIGTCSGISARAVTRVERLNNLYVYFSSVPGVPAGTDFAHARAALRVLRTGS